MISKLLSAIVRDDALALHVAFVPDENHLRVVPRIGLDLCAPVLHRAERVLVGDVVHEDEAHRAAIIGSGNGAIALLTGSVLKNVVAIVLHFFILKKIICLPIQKTGKHY